MTFVKGPTLKSQLNSFNEPKKLRGVACDSSTVYKRPEAKAWQVNGDHLALPAKVRMAMCMHTARNKKRGKRSSTWLPDQEECVNPKIERATPRIKVQWASEHSGFPFKHIICNKHEKAGAFCLMDESPMISLFRKSRRNTINIQCIGSPLRATVLL